MDAAGDVIFKFRSSQWRSSLSSICAARETGVAVLTREQWRLYLVFESFSSKAVCRRDSGNLLLLLVPTR